jgi:hypothetical protein
MRFAESSTPSEVLPRKNGRRFIAAIGATALLAGLFGCSRSTTDGPGQADSNVVTTTITVEPPAPLVASTVTVVAIPSGQPRNPNSNVLIDGRYATCEDLQPAYYTCSPEQQSAFDAYRLKLSAYANNQQVWRNMSHPSSQLTRARAGLLACSGYHTGDTTSEVTAKLQQQYPLPPSQLETIATLAQGIICPPPGPEEN